MGASFAQDIARLKQEVTNLKISHKRGLGTANYYQLIHAARLEEGSQWKITLKANEGAIVPFIAQLYFSFDFGYSFTVQNPVRVSTDGSSIEYYMAATVYNYVYIKVIATSDVSITTEVI